MSEEELLRVMDHMPYGLYIIGSKMIDGDVNAMMADWVMQVSFKPRLLAVSLEHDAHTLANVKANRAFTVNFLSEAEDSMRIAGLFAQPYFGSKVHGPQAGEAHHRKLEGIGHELTVRGCPILLAAMAWLDCEARELITAGDHTIVIGEVCDGRMNREGEFLTSTFTGWNYSG